MNWKNPKHGMPRPGVPLLASWSSGQQLIIDLEVCAYDGAKWHRRHHWPPTENAPVWYAEISLPPDE
jgi:hypothetical protein